MEKQLYYFQTYGELYVIEYEIKIKIKIVSERCKPPLRIFQLENCLNDAELKMLSFYNNEIN